MGLSLNDVNIIRSLTWIRCNDDSKSNYWRSQFINRYGGKFTKNGRYWEWTPSGEQIITFEPSVSEPPHYTGTEEPSKTWIFKNENGDILKTKNIQEFCKINNLTRSSLYEVISGKRKNHKGISFIETTIE